MTETLFRTKKPWTSSLRGSMGLARRLRGCFVFFGWCGFFGRFLFEVTMVMMMRRGAFVLF